MSGRGGRNYGHGGRSTAGGHSRRANRGQQHHRHRAPAPGSVSSPSSSSTAVSSAVGQVATSQGTPSTGEFPQFSAEALETVLSTVRNQRLMGGGASVASSSSAKDVQTQLDQDLFCLTVDRRGCRLDPLQQLKLMDMLCSFFTDLESDGTDRGAGGRMRSYGYFEVIFLGREGETLLHEARISLLIRLTSYACQYPAYGLLSDIAAWLSKVGLGKPYAKEIVDLLMEHFCYGRLDPVSTSDDCIFPLAETCAEFAVYMMVLPFCTSQQPSSSSRPEQPPKSLVSVIAEWLNWQTSLAALIDVLRTARSTRSVELSRKLSEECFANMLRYCLTSAFSSPAFRPIASRFHLGLLKLAQAWSVPSSSSSEQQTTVEPVLPLLSSSQVIEILQIVSRMEPKRSRISAMERFAQVLQIVTAGGSFVGSTKDVVSALESGTCDLNDKEEGVALLKTFLASA